MKKIIVYSTLVALKFLLVCGLQEFHENPIFDPDCKNNFDACKFTVNGNIEIFYDSYLFNSTETTIQFPLATNFECEALFVAVGNGGNGEYYGGGGGSGYIKSDLIKIESIEYEIKIGNQSCPSGSTCVLDKAWITGSGLLTRSKISKCHLFEISIPFMG